MEKSHSSTLLFLCLIQVLFFISSDVIPIWKEVEYYKEYQKKLRSHLGTDKANQIIREALYLVSAGTNDFLENYYTLPERQLEFTIEEYEDFLIGLAENFLRGLYDLGARKVSLTGVPPIGCLPLERSINILEDHGCVEEYNNVALEFNWKLGHLAKKLNKELPGFHVVDANAYDFILQIISQPSLFGFEDARVGCCGTGRFEMGFMCDANSPLTCPDANKYVFWDAFHPSAKTSQLVSNYLIQVHLSKFL